MSGSGVGDSYRLLIFDWDGTLSDSLQRIAHCVRLAAQEMQLALPAVEDVREIVGLSLMEAMARLFPDGEVELHRTLSEGYSRHYRRLDTDPCDFFPGVMETLHHLRDAGFQLAVATGKSRQGLDRVLQRLDMTAFFDATRCADETRSKPHPQMLQELLVEFDLVPDQALMVGDTEFDMEMACSADMPRLAVSYGAHHADRLQRYQPLACIDDFPDIAAYL